MVSKQTKAEPMLNFAVWRQILRQKNLGYLTAKDEKLLDAVALTYAKNERLSVKDFMSKSALGSPAVIHRQIKFLKSMNLIAYSSTEDARRYQVVPSEKLLKYFDALGKAILLNTTKQAKES